MKKILGLFLAGLLLTTNLYAGNGDLIVDGNLGVGTTAPRSKLDVPDTATFKNIVETQGYADIAKGKTPTITSGTFANGGPTYVGQQTYWYTTVAPSSMTIDTGISSYSNIRGIAFGTSWRYSPKMPKDYTIETSSDNVNFTTHVNVTGNTATSVVHFFDSNDRYVRLTVNTINTDFAAISKFQIFSEWSSAGYGGDPWVTTPDNKVFLANTGPVSIAGNVGIGTTNPIQKLTVNGYISFGGSTTHGGIVSNNNGSDGPWVEFWGKDNEEAPTRRGEVAFGSYGSETGNIKFYNYDPSYSYQERMRITPAGYVGIGKTNPSQKLDVAGSVASNGVILTSDMKFKKDIQPVDSSLAKVLGLNGVSYQWKTDEYKDKGFSEGRHYGVIAQEIENVLPEVVSTSADGTKSVAYTEIIPVLIEAFKEQQKEIEELKKKIK